MIRAHSTFAAVVVAVTLATSATLVGQARPEVALRAAIELEEAKGDIKGAIERYKTLAENRDRAVAAQALLRLARSYQRLGDQQARSVFERLVRQFNDQRAPFEEARRALDTPSRALDATARGDRPIWTGPDVDLFGTVSRDGRFVSYVDWQGERNVRVLDLATNTSRALTGNTAQNRITDGDFSAISRDGRLVAYWWAKNLWVAPVQAGGAAPKSVFTGAYLRPFDWSPDAKLIAVLINESRLGILSLEDGALRPLKSSDWQGINYMVFSPDGRFVAYDLAPADQRGSMDIRVIAVDASRDIPVVADGRRNMLMGWSVGGDLVFSSDRSESRSLWTLRVENGRAQGEPRLARENVRADISLGLSPAGTLYVYQAASPSYVRVMAFDESEGRIGGSAQGPLFQQFIRERGRPSWSLNGQLVFFSCGERNSPCSMFIRDGEAPPREVPHGMWYIFGATLSPDGRSIIASGADLKDRGGPHLIDVTSGETTKLDGPFTEYSSDGRWIRFTQMQGDELVLLERPVGGGDAREVFRTREREVRNMRLSGDRKYVGYVHRDTSTGRTTFRVAAVNGGTPRVLADFDRGPQVWQWAPNNQSVFLLKPGGDGSELWQLPLSGNPRKLDVDTRQWNAFHISPDGKKIAFSARAGKGGFEVWALENIVPPAGPRK